MTENVAAADPIAVANELRPVLLRLGRHLRREVHSLGVTGGQVTILARIGKRPGIGVIALAADEGVSAAAISTHVRRLRRAGLIEASRGADRRRVGLALTPDGDRVLRSVRSRRTAWLAARLRRLSPEELERIDAALDALRRVAGDAE
ncbi:MAG TPA: MarR family transcriptional regulator [Gaiellaceae bacterium]|nr:MarR family transcriptional regulator [Gaiellaceae bacterium]